MAIDISASLRAAAAETDLRDLWTQLGDLLRGLTTVAASQLDEVERKSVNKLAQITNSYGLVVLEMMEQNNLPARQRTLSQTLVADFTKVIRFFVEDTRQSMNLPRRKQG
ncbi:hypothetical protein K2O51_31745 (plasmid) [Cupriavidus pinatubonensis]|uniref:hypothetical protein n=1 Tax=Cupriavidus pinatubonensis TaxID=248026 RepID=UPI001C72A442|nr:hypothetical protein [Cupriavidus pinatubonensis]QYY33600.1 hypothetical protein K2O51_31745 [Cupriavidus pinatubonensis]